MSDSRVLAKSMLGLSKFKATEIDANVASIGTINNVQTINGALGQNIILDADTGMKIEMKDDVLMDANLRVISNIDCSGVVTGNNIHVKNLYIDSSYPGSTQSGLLTYDDYLYSGSIALDISSNLVIQGSSEFYNKGTFHNKLRAVNGLEIEKSLSGNYGTISYVDVLGTLGKFDCSLTSLATQGSMDISKNLTVGNTGGSSIVNITGTTNFRDTTDPNNIYMRMGYIPSIYGFSYDLMADRNTYFRVINPDGVTFKTGLQFSRTKVYSDLFYYHNSPVNISYGNQFNLGESDGVTFYGVSHRYYANSDPTAGYQIYNYGLGNSSSTVSYYTNFLHANATNNYSYTMRMNYANIWSFQKHWFSNGVDVSGNLNANSNIHALTMDLSNNLTVGGAINSSGNIHGLSMDISNNLTVGGTTTYGSNLICNGNLHCATFDCSGVGIFSGNVNILGACNPSSLNVTNNAVVSGNLNVTGTSGNNNIYGISNFNGWTNCLSRLNCSENVYITGDLSGNTNTTLNTLTTSGATQIKNNLTINGVDASHNMITQNYIVGDVNGFPNTFKYSTIQYNSNGLTTVAPVLSLYELTSGNSIKFLLRPGGGSYNSIVSAGNRVIMAQDSMDNNNLVLTCWASTLVGLKIQTTSSINATTGMYAGANSIVTNSLTGNTVTGSLSTNGISSSSSIHAGTNIDASGNIVATGNLSGGSLTVTGLTTLNNGTFTGSIYTSSMNTGSVVYSGDSTTQTTAFTNTLSSKLNAIGTVVSGTLSATATLTSGTFYNAGNITLTVGATYMITVNCNVSVITGTTTVAQCLASYSTSSTALSTNSALAIFHGNGSSAYPVGAQWILHSSNILTATVATYYMIVQCNFGTASRLQYVNGNSSFQAVRIA